MVKRCHLSGPDVLTADNVLLSLLGSDVIPFFDLLFANAGLVYARKTTN